MSSSMCTKGSAMALIVLASAVLAEVPLRLGQMRVAVDDDQPLLRIKACSKPLCAGIVTIWYASEEQDPTPEYTQNGKCRFQLPGGLVDRDDCLSIDIQKNGASEAVTGGTTHFAKCTPTVENGGIDLKVTELPPKCNVSIANGVELLETDETDTATSTEIWIYVLVGIAIALILIVAIVVTVVLCVRCKRKASLKTGTTGDRKVPPPAPLPSSAVVGVATPTQPTSRPAPIPPVVAKPKPKPTSADDGRPRQKPWIEKPPSPPSPGLILSATQREDENGRSQKGGGRGVIVTADPSTELDTRPISSCPTSKCTSNCSCQLEGHNATRPRTPPSKDRRKTRGRNEKKAKRIRKGRITKKKAKVRSKPSKSRSKSTSKEGRKCDDCEKKEGVPDSAPHPSGEPQGVVRRKTKPASLGTVPPFSQDDEPPVTASTQESVGDPPTDNKVYDSVAPPEDTQ